MSKTLLIVGIIITSLSLVAITTFTISNFILKRIKKSEHIEITEEQKRNEKIIKRVLKVAKKVIKKVNKSLLKYYYAFYIVGALSLAGGTTMVAVSSAQIASDQQSAFISETSSEPLSEPESETSSEPLSEPESESSSESSAESSSISSGDTSASYTITWKNYDGTTLTSGEVEAGATPIYEGQTPIKPSTQSKVYVFDGWEPAVIAVTSDATYTAKFAEQDRKYNITYKDDEDNILRVDQVAYGEEASYGEDPTKDSTAQYTYNFVSWDRPFEIVTKDTSYIATFNKTTNYYTITWYNDGMIEILSEEYAYGETPSFDDTPERLPDTDGYYTFNGWHKPIEPVTGDDYYQATYYFTPYSNNTNG